MSSSSSEEGCLLVVILDIHPSLSVEEEVADTYFNAATSFVNLFLASSGNNSIAAIAANHAETNFIYPKHTKVEVS